MGYSPYLLVQQVYEDSNLSAKLEILICRHELAAQLLDSPLFALVYQNLQIGEWAFTESRELLLLHEFTSKFCFTQQNKYYKASLLSNSASKQM